MIPGVLARACPLQPLDQLLGRLRGEGFDAVPFDLSCAGVPPLPRRAADASALGAAIGGAPAVWAGRS